MKRIIRLILVVSLLLIALLTFTASAAPADFTYTMKGNGTAIITGYKSNDVNVYIPKMLDGYTVSTIADNAFEGNKTMMTVNIPDTVTSIGDKAFFECENLNGVTIPASVQSIGIGAFAGCDKGLSFAVDKANPVYTTIDQILYNKKTKTLVCCPGGMMLSENTIPNGIEEIGEYAFYKHGIYDGYYIDLCKLPKTIKSIKSYAFADSYVMLNTISVNVIEPFAFKGSEIHTPDHKDRIRITASVIGEYAFINSSFNAWSDTSITIYTSEIKEHSFEGCEFDADVYLPITTIIGEEAFASCQFGKNTTSYKDAIIFLSDKLEEIGDRAFVNAKIYGWVALPDSVKRIGKEAFMNDRGDESRCLISTNTVNAWWVDDREIKLPASLESIGEKAFYFSAERTIIIPESVTEIGDNICDRKYGTLEVVSGSYAATYAAENGYKYMYSGEDDLSWLN